ncbi:MAG: dihydroneopterin aldolase [Bacteroidales bacterium]|jgi:dihydroneopterin aldolase|nr:dihydroneopterin aldolase [Bacteroidales bacterium]
MGRIFLEGMEFHAFHGCFPQERETGNRFVVDVELETGMEVAAESDCLEDTVNYAEIYALVLREMAVPSNLLEHVCGRILKQIMTAFPRIRRAEVKIAKMHPPEMGKLRNVAVSLHDVSIPGQSFCKKNVKNTPGKQ